MMGNTIKSFPHNFLASHCHSRQFSNTGKVPVGDIVNKKK